MLRLLIAQALCPLSRSLITASLLSGALVDLSGWSWCKSYWRSCEWLVAAAGFSFDRCRLTTRPNGRLQLIHASSRLVRRATRLPLLTARWHVINLRARLSGAAFVRRRAVVATSCPLRCALRTPSSNLFVHLQIHLPALLLENRTRLTQLSFERLLLHRFLALQVIASSHRWLLVQVATVTSRRVAAIRRTLIQCVSALLS